MTRVPDGPEQGFYAGEYGPRWIGWDYITIKIGHPGISSRSPAARSSRSFHCINSSLCLKPAGILVSEKERSDDGERRPEKAWAIR